MQAAAANRLAKHQHNSTSGLGADYDMTENTTRWTRQAAEREMDSAEFQHGDSLTDTNFLTSCSYFLRLNLQSIYI